MASEERFLNPCVEGALERYENLVSLRDLMGRAATPEEIRAWKVVLSYEMGLLHAEALNQGVLAGKETP